MINWDVQVGLFHVDLLTMCQVQGWPPVPFLSLAPLPVKHQILASLSSKPTRSRAKSRVPTFVLKVLTRKKRFPTPGRCPPSFSVDFETP